MVAEIVGLVVSVSDILSAAYQLYDLLQTKGENVTTTDMLCERVRKIQTHLNELNSRSDDGLDMDSVLRSISDDFTRISDGVEDVISNVRSRNFKAFLNAHDHEKRLQLTLSHASFCQTRVEAHVHHVNLMDAFGLLGKELREIRNVLSVNGMHSLNVVGDAAQLLHPSPQFHGFPFLGAPAIPVPAIYQYLDQVPLAVH